MRWTTTIALGCALAACGGKEQRRAEADAEAVAARFAPPTVMSRLDYGGMVERRFRRLDRNHDDAITPEELPRGDGRFAALDRDKDGDISAVEWSEGMIARFDANDLNRDGSVTSDERAQAERQRGERR